MSHFIYSSSNICNLNLDYCVILHKYISTCRRDCAVLIEMQDLRYVAVSNDPKVGEDVTTVKNSLWFRDDEVRENLKLYVVLTNTALFRHQMNSLRIICKNINHRRTVTTAS